MSEALYVHQTLDVPLGQRPLRLDKFLRIQLPHVSRTRIQAGIKQGNVLLNNKAVKASYLVRPSDNIQVLLPHPPRMDEITPQDLPLNIIYEDDDLVVVNKAATMVVHPAHENWEGTLVNALLYHFGTLPHKAGNEARPGLVHRLDKGTSGLLVVAKREESLAHLAKQFYDRTVGRKYLALVWGDFTTDEGTIDEPLGRSPKDRRVVMVTETGKKAITHYEVIRRLGYVSLVSCKLETGRTHQIRAHMKHIGHPLFGDTRYGGAEIRQGPRFAKYKAFIQNNFSILPYQALHAETLAFIHPSTGKEMSFSQPPPPAFAEVIERWERYTQGARIS